MFDFDAWKRHRSSGRYWRHMSVGAAQPPPPAVRRSCTPASPLPCPEPTQHQHSTTASFPLGTHPSPSQSLPSSRTFHWVAEPLAFVMTVATAVAVYHSCADVSAHAAIRGRSAPVKLAGRRQTRRAPLHALQCWVGAGRSPCLPARLPGVLCGAPLAALPGPPLLRRPASCPRFFRRSSPPPPRPLA